MKRKLFPLRLHARWLSLSLIASILSVVGCDVKAGRQLSISGSIAGASGVVVRASADGIDNLDTTDSRGDYSIVGLKSGVYRVAPTQPGYVFEPVDYEVTVVDSSRTSVNFERRIPTEGLTPAQADRLDSLRDTWPKKADTTRAGGARRGRGETSISK